MITAARQRGLPNVDFRQQNLFDWTPDRQWDTVFFAHWLAHVPDDLFDPFWAVVGRPSGQAASWSSSTSPTSGGGWSGLTTASQGSPSGGPCWTDGASASSKIFRNPDELAERLAGLGWESSIDEVYPGFLYATCRAGR